DQQVAADGVVQDAGNRMQAVPGGVIVGVVVVGGGKGQRHVAADVGQFDAVVVVGRISAAGVADAVGTQGTEAGGRVCGSADPVVEDQAGGDAEVADQVQAVSGVAGARGAVGAAADRGGAAQVGAVDAVGVVGVDRVAGERQAGH